MKNAYFAGGCFWCITPIFTEIKGVKEVICGYCGGEEIDPTYEDVKNQLTNHRETIKIVYDENTVSYDELLNVFVSNVDIFDEEGQFIDRGRSYTLAIYYTNKDEFIKANAVIDELTKKYQRKVFIKVEAYKMFYEAEEYHQMYFAKNPLEFNEEMEKSGRNNRK